MAFDLVLFENMWSLNFIIGYITWRTANRSDPSTPSQRSLESDRSRSVQAPTKLHTLSDKIISFFFMISKCWTEPPVNQREKEKKEIQTNQKETFFFIILFFFFENKKLTNKQTKINKCTNKLVPQDLKNLLDKNTSKY